MQLAEFLRQVLEKSKLLETGVVEKEEEDNKDELDCVLLSYSE